MTTMDPDEALAKLRRWAREVGGEDAGVDPVQFAEVFEDLDSHLSTGGRPPRDWTRGRADQARALGDQAPEAVTAPRPMTPNMARYNAVLEGGGVDPTSDDWPRCDLCGARLGVTRGVPEGAEIAGVYPTAPHLMVCHPCASDHPERQA